MSNSAGLYPNFKGVDLYESKAKYGSVDFRNRDLTVCTALSASPFA